MSTRRFVDLGRVIFCAASILGIFSTQPVFAGQQDAGIVGSVLYLQVLERTGDFAVFKATGVTNRSLVVGLAFQAVVLAICSAIAALLLSFIIGPLLPMTVEVPLSGYIALPIVAIIVGLLSSLFGLRRAVAVDPALAFGGA